MLELPQGKVHGYHRFRRGRLEWLSIFYGSLIATKASTDDNVSSDMQTDMQTDAESEGIDLVRCILVFVIVSHVDFIL